jgi:hypothetical protein
MTSFRQFEANRRNALSSTGPRTEEGKRRSRQNAVRHGLTAETVVVALEDIQDYHAFEAAVIADYDARTAVERELVLRLASLLWRIRRATAIETDLLEIQAEILVARRYEFEAGSEAEQKPSGLSRDLRMAVHGDADEEIDNESEPIEKSFDNSVTNLRDLTSCFLRLIKVDNCVFERLGRYEVALWRQIVQIMLILRTARYR